MAREHATGRRPQPLTRPHLLRAAAPGRAAGGRSRGQALALLLPLLAALCAALLLVFDSGQLVSEKQRLVNAADAAALSGATWQARALNFESYMTRAVIANEAAIAQSVSLRSWSAYMERMLSRTATLTRLVPYLNAATTALQRFWFGFDQALQPGLGGLEGLLGLVDHDLAAAQRFVHAVALDAVPAAVRGTLAANDPRFTLSAGGEAMLARWSADWLRFTSLYGGAFRWRQRDVLERSLDGFTVSRGVTFSPLLGTRFLAFEKRGGTELLDFETWRGVDTLSTHVPAGIIAGPLRELLPVGWGAAENGRFTPLRGSYGGSTRTNPRATRLAIGTLQPQRRYLGLPSLRDLAVAQRTKFASPRLVVRAALAEPRLVLADRALGVRTLVGPDSRRQADRPTLPHGALFAESVGELRFARPVARADGARELPSLYSPYWRPRLTGVKPEERVIGAALDVPGAPVDGSRP